MQILYTLPIFRTSSKRLIETVGLAIVLFSVRLPLHAQQTADSEQSAQSGGVTSDQDLQARVRVLEQEVAELKALIKQGQPMSAQTSSAVPAIAAPEASKPADPPKQALTAATPQREVLSADDRGTLDFWNGTTFNVALDTYYEYNFNAPVGRVNLLRAYDVLSNNFSLNQADGLGRRAALGRQARPSVWPGYRYFTRKSVK